MIDPDHPQGPHPGRRARLRRQEELGGGDAARHRRGRRAAAVGDMRGRVRHQERHHRRAAARGRRRGAEAGGQARGGPGEARPPVRHRHDALRRAGPAQGGAEIDPRLGRGRLRAGGSLSLLPALDAAGRRHRHRRRDGALRVAGPRPSSTPRSSASGSRTTIRAWPGPWRRSTGGCGAASARSAASSSCTLPCRASARPCRSWRATPRAAGPSPVRAPAPRPAQV